MSELERVAIVDRNGKHTHVWKLKHSPAKASKRQLGGKPATKYAKFASDKRSFAQIAKDSRTSPEDLAVLAEYPNDDHVVYCAVTNPNATPRVWDTALRTIQATPRPSPTQRSALQYMALHGDEEVVEQMLEHPQPFYLRETLMNRNCPPTALEQYAFNGDSSVRRLVARHQNTPSRLLNSMVENETQLVVEAEAQTRDPYRPAHQTAQRLATTRQSARSVLESVVENPRCHPATKAAAQRTLQTLPE